MFVTKQDSIAKRELRGDDERQIFRRDRFPDHRRRCDEDSKGNDVDFQQVLKLEPDGGTTNVRNTASMHWKRWLGVGNRCVVPITSFAEPDPANKVNGERTPNAWFARSPERPLMFFAGIWVPQWESVRKIKEGLITGDLFAFLTTAPNAIVEPVHQKAMPVLLTEGDEIETWLTAPWDVAKVLQRALPEDRMVLLPSGG